MDSIDGTAVRAIRLGNVSGNPVPKTVTNASHLALSLSLSLALSPFEDRFDARKQKENEKGEVEKRKEREREREGCDRERAVYRGLERN